MPRERCTSKILHSRITPKWGPSCVTSAIKNMNFRFGSRFFETQNFQFQSKGYWTFKHGMVQDCILPSMAHSYVMFGMKLNSDLKRFLMWAMLRGFSSHEEFKRLEILLSNPSWKQIERVQDLH